MADQGETIPDATMEVFEMGERERRPIKETYRNRHGYWEHEPVLKDGEMVIRDALGNAHIINKGSSE